MTEEIKRVEAKLDEWKALYEVANRVSKQKPWEIFKETDIIALGNTYETAAYVSVREDSINIYEGVGGLNDFFLLRMADDFGLTGEMAMYSQSFLSMCRGDKDELSREQKKRISEMNMTYRGKDWTYFVSFAEGFYPLEPDKDEVLRLTKYLEAFEKAIIEYRKRELKVEFDDGLMYVYTEENNTCDKKPWPVAGYVARELIAPDELVEEALKEELTDDILEIEMQFAGTSVADKGFLRPVNPRLVLAADAKSGEIIFNKVAAPSDDYAFLIAEFVTDYIFKNGRPKRIKISNCLVESVLKNLCTRCEIDLRVVRILPKLDSYTRQMISMLQNMDEKEKLR